MHAEHESHDRSSTERLRADPAVTDRIWTWFLPALLLFSVLGATWGGLLFQEAETERERASLEFRLTRTARDAVPALEEATRLREEFRQRVLLETIARLTGGRVSLHEPGGRLLLEADGNEGTDPVSTLGNDERGAVFTETAARREVLVWERVRDDAGRATLELRLTAPLLVSDSFPWPFWAGLLGTFGLLSATILLLLTKVLEPLRGVAGLLRELGSRNPLDLERPELLARRHPDIGAALAECVEGLQSRQLRAEESFVEVAIQLAREYEYHAEGEIGHGQRTRRYASWLGERLRLDPVSRDQLDLAALCHDIGRMPKCEDTPFGQDAQLEERHAELGAAYFEAMPGLEDVAEIVRHHHADFDGGGLPENPVGEEIPQGARILRIADEFERIVAGQRDGHPVPVDAAIARLQEGRGKAYDPLLLDLFVEEVALRMPQQRNESSWQDFGVLGSPSSN